MKINCFSITFWFNIYDNHSDFLNVLRENLNDEFENFNIKALNNNLLVPIITSFNNEKKTNLSMSQINFQYNMDKVTMENFEEFQERALKIFELLTSFNIEVLHTAIFINSEIMAENALERITNKTLNKNILDNDLVDTTLKIGKKEEDLFYKIITLLNKKQIKLPKKIDQQGRTIPIPLISWNGALVENEIIDISYEINDKYSYDFTKDYHTTEFYLNKMLYVLATTFEDDINNLLDNE